jgi:outer membrane biosynthesis protein TonB
MRTPLTISAIGHAAVLLWGLVSFATHPFTTPPPESVAVDIISPTELSELMAGSKTAPKAETPKPLVEKVADNKPVDDPAAKVADNKPEVTATADTPPVPTPAPKPEKAPDPKPAVVPQPEPKPKDAQKKPDPPKVDPIAEALKKDDHKPEPKKEAKVTPPPLPPKKPPTPAQPKFDATRIAALLDKRDPQRKSATGDTINRTPTLGASTTNAARLSQSEIDALRQRIQACWSVPAGAAEAKDLVVQVRIQFNQDGSLQAEPILLNHGSGPYFQVAAESALRAVRRCAPYSFLPVAKYDAWKDVEVTFDPRDMYRG